MKTELAVVKIVRLDADIARVWEALTSPALTKKYLFGCEVISEWAIGSSIIWKGSREGQESVFVKGKVVRIVPGRLLQFTTFDPHSGLEDVPANYTTVTFQLSPEGRHTLLYVRQGDYAGVANGEKRYSETVGAWDFALKGLKDLLGT